MKRPLVLLGLVAALLLVACDSGPSREEQAQDRYALELANCAAYYAVMADCLTVTTDEERAGMVQTKVVALQALRMAEELSPRSAVNDRVERATARINRTLQNQCLNPEAVMAEYGPTCAQALGDPQARAAYWLEAVD